MKILKSIILIFLLTGSSFTYAQNVVQKEIKVTGEVSKPSDFNEEALKSFKKTEVVRKDKDGKDHAYAGVMLSELLGKTGATLGSELRGENLTKYILAEAIDGYQVIFALAEVDPEFAERKIILAYEMDGKPLPPADGPFRIIVQGEKKPARCIKQLTSIKVVFAK